MNIPIIDLSNNESKVSKQIVKACEEYGFFKVINHGVPSHIIQTMQDESFEFFRKPLAVKQRVGPANPFGYGNKNIGVSGDRGELEYLLLPTNQDFICNASTLISNTPSIFSCSAVGYVEAARGLTCCILDLIAKRIKVPPSVFTNLLTDHDSDSFLRLNHYPPVTRSFQRGTFGFGEHSDPQILTLLHSNDVPGLEISLPNGLWLPVTPDSRAFCVIVGDLFHVMTNGKFMSVRHRVMANTSYMESRLSMLFFGGPPLHSTIACPPQLSKRNNPPIYRPFTWAEYKSNAYAHRLGESRLDHFKIRQDHRICSGLYLTQTCL